MTADALVQLVVGALIGGFGTSAVMGVTIVQRIARLEAKLEMLAGSRPATP